jgi:tricorn protease
MKLQVVWLISCLTLSAYPTDVLAGETTVFAMDGRWVIEGHGVKPTIEVSKLPYATFNGEDAQLDAAIAYLQKKIKQDPVRPLKAKPFTKNGVPADDIVD